MLDWLAGSVWWEWILVAALVAVVAFTVDRFLHNAGRARNAFDWCVLAFAAAFVGFIASVFLDMASLADEAYGDVPIPGSERLHLPAGDVLVTIHTEDIGRGVGAVIPENLEVVITPPSGVPRPSVTDLLGDYADELPPRRSNRQAGEASRKAMVAHIPVAGDYTVTTSGTDRMSVSPRLSFGRDSIFDFLMWPVFPGLVAVSLVAGLITFPWGRRESDGGPTAADAGLLASGERARGVLKSFAKAEAPAQSQGGTPSQPELPDAPYYALQVELWLPNRLPVVGGNLQQVPLTEVPKLAIGRELNCYVDPADRTRFIVDWNYRLR